MNHLEIVTYSYWVCESARNGRNNQTLTIQEGISACNRILDTTNPNRRISKKVFELLDNIIEPPKEVKQLEGTLLNMSKDRITGYNPRIIILDEIATYAEG